MSANDLIPSRLAILREHGAQGDAEIWPVLKDDGEPVLEDGEAVIATFDARLSLRMFNQETRGWRDVWELPKHSTVFVTDRRMCFTCDKFEVGHRYFGIGGAGAAVAVTLSVGSALAAKARRRGKSVAGQVRYEWLNHVRTSRYGKNASLQVQDGDGTFVGLHFDKPRGAGFDGDLRGRFAPMVTQLAAAWRTRGDGASWLTPEGLEKNRSVAEDVTRAISENRGDVLQYSLWSSLKVGEQPHGLPSPSMVEARDEPIEGDTAGDADIGDIGSDAAAGALGDAPPDGRLGRELFERDQNAYVKLAGSMSSDSDPSQLPTSLQQIIKGTIIPLLPYFDPRWKPDGEMTPLAGAITRFFVEVSTNSYVLATAEEWEGFEAAEFNRVLTDGCLPVHEQSAYADENVRAVLGVIGQTDDYAPLAQYVNSQPANARLDVFAKRWEISPGDALVELIGRDETVLEKTKLASQMAWTSGVMLALLERAGRIGDGAPTVGPSSPAVRDPVAVDASPRHSGAGSRRCVAINCEARGVPTDLPTCKTCGSLTQLI